MTTLPWGLRSLALVLLTVGGLLGLAGCHAVDFYQESLQAPVPSALEPPRELSMMSLPAYRVEPPDILQIEMLKLVPLPPYRIEIYDVLQIRVLNTPSDQPIYDFFLVEGEGIVTLGPAYGRVRVAGMTIEEATETITRKLREMLVNPEVSVQLARTAGTQPLTGQYLIGPDGTINLRQYGTLHVAGKTITEIRLALQKHLSQYFDSPEASVDVIAFNSKVFYVITEGAGMGDDVRRIPITGNETVLDAISSVNGLSQVSSAHVWVARPAAGRVWLRSDPAGGLRGGDQGRLDRHQLPDHAGRPGVHCRRQRDRLEQLADEVDLADRAAVGRGLAGHLGRRVVSRPSAVPTTRTGAFRRCPLFVWDPEHGVDVLTLA